MSCFEELKQRGFVAQVTDEDAVRRMLDEESTTFYVGFDPTAASPHVGHLYPTMVMMHLQKHGHRPIMVLGVGTAMIGDPSGKTELRQMMSEEKIRENAAEFRRRMNHFLHFEEGRALCVDNSEWLQRLGYIEFLRDIGRHFSVNRMLAAEAYKQRLERGLSFIEFNYQILQAYDFLELNRREGCTLQIGGDDQWGNILAGVDLTRRLQQNTVQGMTTPLLTTASGAKMGKTAAGAVWIDPELLSAYDFYQYWINVDDRDVDKLLKCYTFLSLEEIAELSKLEGAEIRHAKEVLAFEMTQMVHGQAAAEEARAGAKAAFSGKGDVSNMPSVTLPAARFEEGVPAYELFTEIGLAGSRGEARRLLQQGGGYVNEQRIEAFDRPVTKDDIQDGAIVLRAGKKKHFRIEVE